MAMQSQATGQLGATRSPAPEAEPAAAAAAGGGASNFIGSLISLISRSDIRYQGFLASIDAGQATIALEKGECARRVECVFRGHLYKRDELAHPLNTVFSRIRSPIMGYGGTCSTAGKGTRRATAQ